MDSAKKVYAITGVMVKLKDGEHILWRVSGKAQIEVKAELGLVMALVHDGDAVQ
jgi:hypothetical protein